MKGSGYIVCLLLSVWLLQSGCEVNRSVSGRNIGFLYNQGKTNKLGVEYQVFSNASGALDVFIRIDPSTMALVPAESGKETVGYSCRYKVYTSYSEPMPIDSGHIVAKDKQVFGGAILDSFKLKVASGRNYLLDITIHDLNSPKVDKQYIDILNTEAFSRQRFRVVDKNEMLLFEPYIFQADSYFIVPAEPVERLFARFYERDFPIASPPFSVVSPKPFDFTPDKSYSLEPAGPNRFKINVLKKGFYQITGDTTKRSGGTLFFFGNYFPEARTVQDLLSPLRYITTLDEYNSIAQGDNIKKNVDEYWLKLGGNTDRARSLIEAYYSRVEFSNRYFTSYLEGWKSDRGMCYIVFGPPDIVYRSTSSERWVYGEDGRYNSLSLTFTKVINPFTSNDFRLNRSGSLKTPWYRAVEFWRQGRVLTYQ